MSWEKTKAETLRQALIDKCGFSEEDANNVKGKTNLVMCFVDRNLTYEDVFGENNDEVLDVDLDNLPPEPDVVEEVSPPKENNISTKQRLQYGQEGWSDYVMSLFTENELVDGKPKLHGLRRVAETLLGAVVFSGPIDSKVYFSEDPEEIGKACVTYQLEIQFKLDLGEYVSQGDLINGQYPVRRFSAIAGACLTNTDPEYAIYPEAIAESRAEARAYRKALQIDSVAHEEVSSKSGADVIEHLKNKREREVSSEYNENDDMQYSQKNFIETKSAQLNIDVGKLCMQEVEKDFDQLTRKEAQNLIKKLNEYQTNHKDSSSIPKEIKL